MIGSRAPESRLKAILKQRCPQCLRGRVFQALLKMNPTCPVCSFVFEPEPGYFVGAMYVSYGLAILALLPTVAALALFGIPDLWIIFSAVLELIVLSPFTFRYSRVIWLHFERLFKSR